MWNKIEEKVLEKYMSEPKDSDIYQDFWKDILADYSADYWKLARAVPFKIDTIGWQLMGSIVDDRDDIEKIDCADFQSSADGDYIQINYVSPFGYYVYIPLGWFKDRNDFLRKWVEIATDEYISEIERNIISMRNSIEKKEKELEKIKNINVIEHVFGKE